MTPIHGYVEAPEGWGIFCDYYGHTVVVKMDGQQKEYPADQCFVIQCPTCRGALIAGLVKDYTEVFSGGQFVAIEDDKEVCYCSICGWNIEEGSQ